MEIDVTTTINTPVSKVWKILAEDFADIQVWLNAVKKSYEITDATKADGAPLAGRICEFTDDGNGLKARESITSWNAAEHRLGFEVVPEGGGLLPVIKNVVDVLLTAVDDNTTKLDWHCEPELKAHGYLMYPLLKAKNFFRTSLICMY